MEENEIYSVLGEEGFTRLVHYLEQRGHPRLRMRHAPFPVDQAARDRWMKLMENALTEVKMPEEAKQILRSYFQSTATAMMNRQ